MRRSRMVAVAVGAVVVLLMSGCGAGDELDDTADTAEADGRGDDLDEDAGPGDDVIASAETTWGGGPSGGEVRFDLLDVTRRGEDVLEVRFALTAIGDNEWVAPYGRLNTDDVSTYDVSGITVEDVEAGERLLVLRDATGGCVCSTDLGESIPQRSTREFFARFPAPVSDRVDVAVPTFGTFNDVTVR